MILTKKCTANSKLYEELKNDTEILVDQVGLRYGSKLSTYCSDRNSRTAWPTSFQCHLTIYYKIYTYYFSKRC